MNSWAILVQKRSFKKKIEETCHFLRLRNMQNVMTNHGIDLIPAKFQWNQSWKTDHSRNYNPPEQVSRTTYDAPAKNFCICEFFFIIFL